MSTPTPCAAPDSPFPLHRFDPAESTDACGAWRVVSGGNRQWCPYAQPDPVHLESARTRSDPATGELRRPEPA